MQPPTSAASVPVLILAGGLGTRISEESQTKPKPMVEIGGIPILVHIMRHYYAHGFNDFVICGGYKAIEIKKYFLYYQMLHNDLDIDHRNSFDADWKFREQNGQQEKWRVRVLDTGANTMTGARIGRALKTLSMANHFDHFAVTYGDGLSDVNLTDEYAHHLSHGYLGTVLGVKNTARYGELEVMPNGKVRSFVEKPANSQGFINGGFFFFRREFEEYLGLQEGLVLEDQPLTRLAADGQLNVFRHLGFWHAMDTLRDRNNLEKLWATGQAPWSHPMVTPVSAPVATILEPRA
ncbi:NTP transferase domain-containing protein [bacterium]|nr:NTP transferase domain-containing protein [bacterium]